MGYRIFGLRKALHKLKPVLLLCAVFVSLAVPVQAEDKEALVKSAYIFNFTKFVSWPQVPDHIAVCAFSTPIGGALKGIERESTPEHAVEVHDAASLQHLSNCHLAYTGSLQAAERTEMLNTVANMPVLTVGEGAEFIDEGGMVAFVKDKNHIRLQINLRAAEKAGLKLDPQLLEVAQRVIR